MEIARPELVARLELIERMIQEGRRTVERWGWVYAMWGVGHVVGVAATFAWPARAGLVWAVAMATCGVTMGVVASRRQKNQRAEPQLSRALSAVWGAFGLMLVFLFSSFVAPATESASAWCAVFSAAYGGAFFASGHIAQWAPMKANGLLWGAAAIAMKFIGDAPALAVFGAMALFGEIGFGLYAMAHERKTIAVGQ